MIPKKKSKKQPKGLHSPRNAHGGNCWIRFFSCSFRYEFLDFGISAEEIQEKGVLGGYTGDLRKSGQKTERVRESVCVDRGSRFVPFTQLVWYIIWSKFSLPLSDMYGLLGRRAFLRAAFVLETWVFG